MEFNTPIKKNNVYISTLEKNININIIDVKIVNIQRINTEKIILELYINDNKIIDYLENFEKETIKTVKENNNKWFKNNMTDEKLINLYEPSFDSQTNILKVYVYNRYSPKIMINEELCDNIYDVINNEIKEKIISIELRYLGIYIQSTSFENKWLIKSIHVMTIEEEMNDKDMIYESWENELKKKETEIYEKIRELTEFKDKMWEIYKKSKENTQWKEELEKLRNLMNKFFI